MVRVYVTKQSGYPVKAVNIKRKLKDFLEKRGIASETEVSVALVGKAKMLALGEKYLKDSRLHDVLSFEMEDTFRYPPDGTLYLGEIVVCYPAAVKEAIAENKLIEDKVYELIEHGALHLLGVHHEDGI